MSQLDDQRQQWVAQEAINAIHNVLQAEEYAALQKGRPCVIFRPRLSLNGSQWCAQYVSEDMAYDGPCGFGPSPAAAMLGFDKAWNTATEDT